MRKAIAVMALLCCCASTTALAQVSFAFDSPGVSIAVNVPVYPDLVRVPGYPVYYAPQLRANYFFYDGLYWVFADGEWYASPWYNGPWQLVADDAVPLFVLRVPVRYYRAPPSFFRGWAFNAPPRWGEHWGARWEEHHRGWDHWNRSAVPAPAPLPVYQRNYTGNRYPRNVEEQRTLETRNYHYQPRDRFAQQHVQRGAPVQNAQAPRPVTRSNTANAPRPREESPQRAGGTPPTVAHRTPQPGPHAESPAVAQRHAPVTEQHAQAPRPEQRAQAPRPEPRAQAPRPEQHAATPRPEQHAAPRQRAQQSAPPVARGPAQPPQAQGHAPGNKGPAQAEHGGNENARAGERRNEHNG